MTRKNSTRFSLAADQQLLDMFKNPFTWGFDQEEEEEGEEKEKDTRYSNNKSDKGALSFQRSGLSADPQDTDMFRRKSRISSKDSGKDKGRKSRAEKSAALAADLTPIEDLESLEGVWSYFSQQTSFHGIKNIESPERKHPTRIFYLLLVLCMAGSLAYNVTNLLIEYYQYRTVTRSDVAVRTTDLFPSVTLCNNCPYRDLNAMPAFRRIVRSLSLLGDAYPLNTSDPEVLLALQHSMIGLQEKYSFTAEEFFISSSYEGVPLNVSLAFENVDTSMGRCFTFNGPRYIEQHGSRLVTSDGRNSGLRAYIKLHQDQYFTYDDMTAGIRMFVSKYPNTPRLNKDGIDVQPGTSTRVALSPVKFTFLPSPYSSFGGQSCDDHTTHSSHLVQKMVNSTFYSYDLCLEQCMNAQCTKECGCYTSILYLPVFPECTLGQTLLCIMPCYVASNSSLCDCPRPCTFTRYQVTVSQSRLPSRSAAKDLANVFTTSDDGAALRYSHLLPSGDIMGEDYLELRVYFDTMMERHEKHEPEFTFSSMFAFLGGQMGFFMGASLITLSELLETLAFTAYVCLHKKIMRMGQLNPQSAASSSHGQPHSNEPSSKKSSNISDRGLPPKQAW